jgi:hypothetical protein
MRKFKKILGLAMLFSPVWGMGSGDDKVGRKVVSAQEEVKFPQEFRRAIDTVTQELFKDCWSVLDVTGLDEGGSNLNGFLSAMGILDSLDKEGLLSGLMKSVRMKIQKALGHSSSFIKLISPVLPKQKDRPLEPGALAMSWLKNHFGARGCHEVDPQEFQAQLEQYCVCKLNNDPGGANNAFIGLVHLLQSMKDSFSNCFEDVRFTSLDVFFPQEKAIFMRKLDWYFILTRKHKELPYHGDDDASKDWCKKFWGQIVFKVKIALSEAKKSQAMEPDGSQSYKRLRDLLDRVKLIHDGPQPSEFLFETFRFVSVKDMRIWIDSDWSPLQRLRHRLLISKLSNQRNFIKKAMKRKKGRQRK